MFKIQFLMCITILLAGCGVRPQVDFYMNPVATGEEQRIDEETGSVTVEENNVRITISAVDTVDLLEMTSDVHANPYIYVGDWGVARPLYTVFDVAIKNKRESKVLIDPSGAVLMDEQGEQYDAISHEALRERYEIYPRPEREIIHYPPPPMYYRPPYYRRRWERPPWYYHHDRYWWRRPYYVRRIYNTAYFRRAIAKGTLLKPVKLYPGGKRQGFLIFSVLPPDAGKLELIIPGITIYRGDQEEKMEFQFHFEQIPAARDKNDNKEDVGAGRG